MNHNILSQYKPIFLSSPFFPATLLFNKQTCLLGTGRRALTNMIYIAELWNNNITKVWSITELAKSCLNTIVCIDIKNLIRYTCTFNTCLNIKINTLEEENQLHFEVESFLKKKKKKSIVLTLHFIFRVTKAICKRK